MSSELAKEDIFRMFAETKRIFDKEIREAFAETDRKFQETDRKFQETDRKFQETDKEIKELAKLFTGQWGKLIEALVKPSALKLFQERGIKVTETHQRVESYRNSSQMEIDIFLSNDQEVVVIEVKTTLKVQDVREFLEKLRQFTFFFPKYKGVKLYGAVAGVQIEEDADKFAYRRGLFVLAGSGEGLIKILNDESFRPKNFEEPSVRI